MSGPYHNSEWARAAREMGQPGPIIRKVICKMFEIDNPEPTPPLPTHSGEGE